MSQPTIEFLNRIYADSPSQTATHPETIPNRAIPVFLALALPLLGLGTAIGLSLNDTRYEASIDHLKNKLESTQHESISRQETIVKQQKQVKSFCEGFNGN